MNLRDIIVAAGHQAKKSGFRTPGFVRSVAEHVALITTEIGELYEAHRDGRLPAEHLYEYRYGGFTELRPVSTDEEKNLGKPVGIPSELADIVIRVCDMAEELGIDLERAVIEKLQYNATRPLKHGRQS